MNAPAVPRTGPSIKRGSSKQDYSTPRAFIDAVAERFGSVAFDLAATRANSVAGVHCYFGQDHEDAEMRDALAQDWNELDGVLWLNPPFADIEPWAAKCASVRHRPDWTLLLTPASIGARWFERHVKDQALVLVLSSRLTFDKDPYPKDLMLSCFGFGARGFDTWDWKAQATG